MLSIDFNILKVSAYDTYIQADDGGHYKYSKTAIGQSYTACTKSSTSSHYWSTSTGSNSAINDAITSISYSGMRNYGSTTSGYVPLFENVYLSRGSVIRFEVYGRSCSHSYSNAVIYISDAHSSPFSYNSSNQSNYVGELNVPKSSSGQNDSEVFYYEITQSGYYTVDGQGMALKCETSYGHGIFISSEYYIYTYEPHHFTWTTDTYPTCTETGYRTGVCRDCGYTTSETTPALGHLWDSGTVTTAPTADSTGIRTYTCRRDSNHTYTETETAFVIRYNANGGTNVPSPTVVYDTLTKNISSSVPTKTGYLFRGWSTSSSWSSDRMAHSTSSGGQTARDGTKASITSAKSKSGWASYFGKSLSSTSNTDVTLYAQWEPIQYYVMYHGNGNFNTEQGDYPHPTILTYDVDFTLLPNEFTRDAGHVVDGQTLNTGYAFTGWGLSSDSKSISYSDKQTVRNLTATDGATVHLYAVWKRDLHLRFDLNGGSFN